MGPRKKVVLVGITASGKTSLYNCISGEVFESAYTPTTVEDSGQKNISINGQKVELFDTIGGKNCGFDTKNESKTLRKHYYSKAHLILLCYSVDDVEPFRVIEEYKENIKQFCSKARLILIATKSDLRQNKTTVLISKREGKAKSLEIGALKHFECSSLTDYRVIELLGAALKAVKLVEETERMNCVIE